MQSTTLHGFAERFIDAISQGDFKCEPEPKQQKNATYTNVEMNGIRFYMLEWEDMQEM